ncbi:dolichyl-phosphate beta-glucosyltransferase [Dispira parvispora]|uniref:dolichyl-phosphate beta-glucosyltransferase n=1 Tax=Dispira parvispora TaxID=1520584 RepID=A0A9W8AR95_9FUNG|nr:dolichyl-phosphate beta-glucosyltransferase [Dispira parvispora]
MDTIPLFTPTAVLGLLLAVVVFVLSSLALLSPKPRAPTAQEKMYRDLHHLYRPLPSLFDPPTVTLTVVVPAYNESRRLPKMLQEALTFLKTQVRVDRAESDSDGDEVCSDSTLNSPSVEDSCRENLRNAFGPDPLTYEFLVVDDGSTDNTSDVALQFARKHHVPNLRVLTFERNRGKGGAVTQGFLHARGRYILFADADGATDFQDVAKVFQALTEVCNKDGCGVAVGSRAHLKNDETNTVVKRSWVRTVLMHAFHTFVCVFGIRDIEDTQCGFKLFTRPAAQAIFSNIHVERWIFDIEVLLLARVFNIPVVEVPVTWYEIAGSKMSLMRDAIVMATDLLILRLNYILGIWRARPVVSRDPRTPPDTQSSSAIAPAAL